MIKWLLKLNTIRYEDRKSVRLTPVEGGITTKQKRFLTTLMIRHNDRKVYRDEYINNLTIEQASEEIDYWMQFEED